MDASTILHLARHHAMINKYPYTHENPYGQLVAPPSSYIRSSAPRPLQPIPSHYISATASADSPPSSASSSNFPDGIYEPTPDYVTQPDPSATGGRYYNAQCIVSAQHSTWIPVETKMPHDLFPSVDLNFSLASHILDNPAQMLPKADDSQISLSEDPNGLPPYYANSLLSYGSYEGQSYGGTQAVSAPDTITSIPPHLLSNSCSSHIPLRDQDYSSYGDVFEPSYGFSPASSLRHSSSSPESIHRYIAPAQISPVISPVRTMFDPQQANTPPACDPRSTMHRPAVSSEVTLTEREIVQENRGASGSPQLSAGSRGQPPTKRRRKLSISSDSSESYRTDSSSGESEKSDDAEDDDEYVEVARAVSAPHQRRNRASSTSSPARSASSHRTSPRRVSAPIPVPNLTKKSRGRRVPTVPQIERDGGMAKNARMYLCDVPGCNKCFARGEHLKRHVRSIHTNEKPHKCLHCSKDFSRHDNLVQHMRVHGKNLPKVARIA